MKSPNFSGLWRLNPAKSRLVRVSKIAMKIEHDGACFIQDVKALSNAGSISLGRFVGNTSGGEFSNDVRGLTMVSTATWSDDELIIESRIDAGEGRAAHFRDHWSLSHDGTELRMEHRDDDIAGQLTVLERVTETHGA
jgi:hypothetical protein